MAPPFSAPQTQLYSPEKGEAVRKSEVASRMAVQSMAGSRCPPPRGPGVTGSSRRCESLGSRLLLCLHIVLAESWKSLQAGKHAVLCDLIHMSRCSLGLGLLGRGGGRCAMHAFSVHLECEAPVSMLRGMCVRLQSLVGQ